MKKLWLILCIGMLLAGLWAMPVKITSWRIEEDVKILNSLNVSIDYVNRSTNTIIIDVRDDNEFALVKQHGFAAEKMPYEARDYASQLWEETKDSDNPMRAYYSFDQYTQFMQQMADQYPSICQLVQIGTSIQGRPILFLKISDNVLENEAEPEFRYVSS
ncbi:MAG: M14 family zinc carboxypeptidase, partial [Candidatus Cloacimonadaceae bacterium]|nr:M14 family zinc carboxypeptidase [Candidatus Cloacimonadaceae bacterium]